MHIIPMPEGPSIELPHSLGQLQFPTSVQTTLTSEKPVGLSLLIAAGAIAAIIWVYGAVQREVQHAKRQALKSLGF